MKKIQVWGNILLGIALTGFAISLFATQHFLQGLLPVGDLPLYIIWVNVSVLLFFISGFLFVLRKSLQYATTIAGSLFFLFFLYPHLPRVFADPHNGSEWTGTIECLAISSGIFLTGLSQLNHNQSLPVWMSRAARYVFAFCLLVFGIQHFMYAEFIATLLPGWMPVHLFWAYFVGIAFTAASISLFSGVLVKLSATLLALMFLLWVVILHAPRVVASPKVEPEWTSMFVALAMGAIALLVSRLATNKSFVFKTNAKDKEAFPLT